MSNSLALYTTIYPSVEKFIPAWYESVRAQTDQNFDIWIGLDNLEPDRLRPVFGSSRKVEFVRGRPGDTPAQVRSRVWEIIVGLYPAVVLMDSDDLFEPTRVEAARQALEEHDVTGCRMKIIDEKGRETGHLFGPSGQADFYRLILNNNVFGLSNTAYRSELLKSCLPLPPQIEIVDWYLITKALVNGLRIHFDTQCRMSYRQYDNNIAKVLPPFSGQQVKAAAKRVLIHYAAVLDSITEMNSRQREDFEKARARVSTFYSALEGSEELLERYTVALNLLPPTMMWWAAVAHPALQHIYSRQLKTELEKDK